MNNFYPISCFQKKTTLLATLYCLALLADAQLKKANTPQDVQNKGIENNVKAQPLPRYNKVKKLTPTERLSREFESGRSATLYGLVMHSLDRILSGEKDRSDFDIRVERAMLLNPSIKKEYYSQMLAEYKSVPVEIRAKAMPMDLAALDVKRNLSLEDTRNLLKAPKGSTMILMSNNTNITQGLKITTRPIKDVSIAPPFITSCSLIQTEPSKIKLVLTGLFDSPAEAAVIYLKPKQGQSLENVNSQTVDEEKVGVVLGKISQDKKGVTASLPAGLAPGKYEVSLRVPKGKYGNEHRSNRKGIEVGAYAYHFQLLSIKCIDESNPETVIGFSVTDEVQLTWTAFCDSGKYVFGETNKYEGFNDGDEQHINTSSGLGGSINFFRRASFDLTDPDDNSFLNRYVFISNRVFLNFRLFEMDYGDTFTKIGGPEDFFADLELEGLDIDAINFQQERLAQFHSSLLNEGDNDPLGEVRLTFSAGDLQEMTNNDARLYKGKLEFINDDDIGSYEITYEIRRAKKE